MKMAIMQPYFMPYLGYFQLIAAVDLFVIYDNIQYTKSGWINRNRIYGNGEAVTISLPLKSASDYLDVRERELAADFRPEKLLNKIRGTYLKAPYFGQTFPLVETIMRCEETNLFRFLEHCIRRTCDHVGVTTEIKISSSIPIDHGLKKQDKVLAFCEALGASAYVNAIGGLELYRAEEFHDRGVDLKFIRMKPFEYAQFGEAFVPMLSIIDVMMFNSIPDIRSSISGGYELI